MAAGSAIHATNGLPDALGIVCDHHANPARMPTVAVLVCMTLAMRNDEQDRKHGSTRLAPARAQVPPVCDCLFASGLDLRRIASRSNRLNFRRSVQMGAWKEGDHRDWEAIRTWTTLLRRLLEA